MTIVIADDNKPFREALKIYLETEQHHKVISENVNGNELLHNRDIANADILLVDIEMPVLNGIEAVKQIIQKMDWVKAIAITNYHEKAYLKDLILTGFKGCVFKDSIYQNIGIAIQKVSNGGVYFPDNIIFK